MNHRILLSAMVIFGVARGAAAGDWPCFRGADYDGISRETDFLVDWPEQGPPVLWSREVGPAFSSFAVVGDRAYTCGTRDHQQVIYCLDAERGDVLWKRFLEPVITDPDPNIHGTRATPTVDGGRVYMMASLIHLFCFDARSGEVIWKEELHHKPNWGYAGSALVDGELVIVQAGGDEGSLRALDKKTGKLVWQCGDDPAGYATPYPFTLDGRRYVCGFTGASVIIAERDTGALALRLEWPSHSGVNVATPIFHNGRLFVSTGYGYGAGVFKLAHVDGKLTAEQVWKSLKIRNKFQTPVLLEGKLYTSDERALKCVDFASGEVLWSKPRIVHSPLLAAGGHLLLLRETGELHVARASPIGFKSMSRVQLFEGNSRSVLQRLRNESQGRRCWTAPVLANGRLYVRDHTTVVCLDLRKDATPAKASAAVIFDGQRE